MNPTRGSSWFSILVTNSLHFAPTIEAFCTPPLACKRELKFLFLHPLEKKNKKILAFFFFNISVQARWCLFPHFQLGKAKYEYWE